MSLSGHENTIRQFPQTEASKERFAQQKLKSVQTMDELILAIEETDRFKGETSEEVLRRLAILISQLEDLKVLNQLPVCNLTEFPDTLGLRQAIGRAFISSGYEVNPAVFEDPEPPLAS